MNNYEPYVSPYRDQYFGYYYQFFSEKSVYQNFLRQVEKFNLGINYYNAFNTIFRSRYWDRVDFNIEILEDGDFYGTISGFFHGYPTTSGFPCLENDIIFLYLDLKISHDINKSLYRYFKKRFKTQILIIKNIINKNRSDKPEWFIRLYEETLIRLKNEYNLNFDR